MGRAAPKRAEGCSQTESRSILCYRRREEMCFRANERSRRMDMRSRRRMCFPENELHVVTSVSEAELQATAMTRFYPGLRIASFRFHMCKEDYADAVPACQPADLYAWVSFGGCARACEQGLTSEGWEGHEVFNIVAPEICWEGGIHVEEKSEIVLSEKVGSLALLEEKWKGKYTGLREGWWEGNPRRSFWDCAKAERMLGWQHDEA